jgi:cation diffusion facilitator CzcD-associated flavoprotein CzcO
LRSAIQIIPNLAPRTKHLYSYQRTPTWCGPRNQLDYPTFIKWIFTYIPLVMFLYRIYMFFAREMLFGAWKDSNSWIANSAKNSTAKYMKDTMIAHHRQDLVDKLIPSFPVGCKRIGISDDYIPALCANNVSVNCEPISKVEGRTITTIDRNETEVDVLVLATGFNVAGFLGELKIYGRGGVSLNQLWDEYTAKTYKTVNVHGFPNFFITLGPGSALGHNSVVTIIERLVYMLSKLLNG